MQNYQMMQQRSRSTRKRWTYAGIALAVIAVIIVIVVPCAILIPRSHRPPAATILLPLYIYPESNSTYAPLYNAIQAQPKLDFVVIINPSSGPGNTTTPSEEYTQQVVQLNGIKSVDTIGYVRTNYTNRPIDDVLADIRTYAGWSTANANLTMHGIFLDESPHQYTDSAASYMRTVTSAIKSSSGIQGQKLVVRNPGTIPDQGFNDPNTDVVVFFESDYTSYQNQVSSLQSQPNTRSKYSIMVNSVPSMSSGGLRNYVVGLSRLAEYLFVTDNTQDYYESFGSDWNEFTSVVPTN